VEDYRAKTGEDLSFRWRLAWITRFASATWISPRPV